MKLFSIALFSSLLFFFFSHFALAQNVDVGALVDNSPPTISITDPEDGETVSGTVTIAATASDDSGIAQVEFYIDGLLKFTDSTFPYSFNWDSSTVVDGSHTISAKAIDLAGKTSSDSIQVKVKNEEEALESPTKKTKPPTVEPPTASPSPRRVTLFDLPEDRELGFILGNWDFLLGILFGIEVILILFLIIRIRRFKSKNQGRS